MRRLRSALLVVPLAVSVAVGLFWFATMRDQNSSARRPPEPQTASPERRQASPQAGVNAPGSSPRTPDTAEPEGASDTSAVFSGQPRDDLTVWGTVRMQYGEAVAGQPIKLYSGIVQQTYTTFSDRHGGFVIDNVSPAVDYTVIVPPETMSQSYRRRDVTIAADNNYLEIVLEPLQVGVLEGRIVTPRGRLVPDFDIKIRSLSASRRTLKIRSDSVGLFRISDFPKGSFEVFSRRMLLRIDGLVFDPDAGVVMDLVVDHGPHRLFGRVMDSYGQYVPGATVVLSWEHAEGDVRSTARRSSLTDAEGGFAIDGLAFGKHELEVSLPDSATLKRSVMIGEVPADLVLYLDRQNSHTANYN